MAIRQLVGRALRQARRDLERLELHRGALKWPVYGAWQREVDGASATILAEKTVPHPREGDRVVDPTRKLSMLVADTAGVDDVYFRVDCYVPLPVPVRAAAPSFTATPTRYATFGKVGIRARTTALYRCRIRLGSESYWLRSVIRRASSFTFTNLPFGVYVVGLTAIDAGGMHSQEGLREAIELGV